MPIKIKQSKLKTPKLRFPGFSGEWGEKRLGEILELKNGINFDKNSYGKGYKFINVLDIINNQVIKYEDIIGRIDISINELENNLVSYGDVLFQRSSEVREEVGQSNVYLGKKKVTFGGFIIRGKSISKHNPIFLNYLLKTASVRKEITSWGAGSTRYNIGQDNLRKVKVSLPSIPEQQKIADFLGSVDERLENLREQKKFLEDYKKGMMQKIFSQEIRFKDENGKDFPGWEDNKLGEVCKKESSGISANSLEDNYGKYKIYGAKGEYKKVDFYQQNELYISIVKDGAGVGRILICEPKTSVLGTLDIIKPKKQADVYFLYFFMSRIKFIKYTKGSTIPHIYFKDYKKEIIQMPSIKEQQKIAAFLTSIDNLINLKQQQIDQSEQWKKGLMQGLFV